MRLNVVRRAGSLIALFVVAFAVPLSSPQLVRGQAVRTWIGGGNATNPNANLFIYGVNASLGLGF